MSLYPSRMEEIAKKEALTDRISIGITTGDKIMTIIDGKPFVQCRMAVIVAPNEQELSWRLGQHGNMDDFLASRSAAEKELDFVASSKGSTIITPEEEMFVHKANLQTWIENDYAIDIIDSKIAFPILKELAKTDRAFEGKLYYEVERRWIEGSDNSRRVIESDPAFSAIIERVEASICLSGKAIHSPKSVWGATSKISDAKKKQKLIGCINEYFKDRGLDVAGWLDFGLMPSESMLRELNIESIGHLSNLLGNFKKGKSSLIEIENLLHSGILTAGAQQKLIDEGTRLIGKAETPEYQYTALKRKAGIRGKLEKARKGVANLGDIDEILNENLASGDVKENIIDAGYQKLDKLAKRAGLATPDASKGGIFHFKSTADALVSYSRLSSLYRGKNATATQLDALLKHPFTEYETVPFIMKDLEGIILTMTPEEMNRSSDGIKTRILELAATSGNEAFLSNVNDTKDRWMRSTLVGNPNLPKKLRAYFDKILRERERK